MKYTVHCIGKGSGEKFIFDFEPENIVLTNFFIGDFSGHSSEYLCKIENVLKKKSEEEVLTGNDSCVVFHEKISTVENLFPEDETQREICTISTQELRTLMDDWLRESKKFKESQKEKAD